MAKLLIWGHKTRSQEVIKILKMLGGKNVNDYVADASNCVYSINEQGIIDLDLVTYSPFIALFTLEGFLKKFPYKVGDKVLIKPYVGARQIYEMKWDSNDNCIKYGIGVGEWFNVSQLQLYKEENMEKKIESFEILESYCADEVKIEFDPSKFKMIERKNGYYVVKKQPEYPKTFIEVLNFWHPDRQIEDDYQRCYKKGIIEKFQDLLYARDAYWKIAGEQMGLGKSWEPDWKDESEFYYTISYNGVNIRCYNYTDVYSKIVFPTEEMRDAFYGNFKDLIEKCKELL